MKIIAKDVDYAVRALLYLAQNKGDKVTISELARNLGISRPFLRKILQNLAKTGILDSNKGKGGGFVLKQAPKDILLSDLVNALHGEINIIDCEIKGKVCSNKKICGLRKRVKSIESNIVKQLRGVTIASLVKKVK